MAFNISNFRSGGLVYGGARPSQFEIQMKNPLNDTKADEKITLLARSAQLPGMSTGSIDIPYFGRQIKIAGDRTFQDYQITIMNDEDFVIRRMFEEWSQNINSLIGNKRELAKYKVDHVEVTQFGKTGEKLRKYVFDGMFPTQISPINLDWDQTNQIETFDVTFSYDWFEPVSLTPTLKPELPGSTI